MDPLTLATTIYIIAKPFIEKTGEGVARKVGEDVWNLVKKAFSKTPTNNLEKVATESPDLFKSQLQTLIEQDSHLKNDLLKAVEHSNEALQTPFIQKVENQSNVEKQINIVSNTGNISM